LTYDEFLKKSSSNILTYSVNVYYTAIITRDTGISIGLHKSNTELNQFHYYKNR